MYILNIEHQSETENSYQAFPFITRELAEKVWNAVIDHLFAHPKGALYRMGCTRYNEKDDSAYTVNETPLAFHFHENYAFNEWDIYVDEKQENPNVDEYLWAVEQ